MNVENRNKALFKNTIVLSIGQFVPKLLAIITLPILTGSLSQTDYGLYELSLSVASFCIPLLSVQIQQAAFRFLIDPNEDRRNIISNSFLFLIIVFSIAGIPVICGWYLFSKSILIGILFYICYFSEVLLNWAGQVSRGVGDNLRYSLAYVLYSVLFFAYIGIRYLIKEELGIVDVSIAIILSYSVSFLYLFIIKKLSKEISFSLRSTEEVKKLLAYSAPMVISSVALWIVNLSDRFFVTGILGIEVTAVYGVANKIPNLFNTVYNVFNLAWTENTSRLTENEKREGYYTAFFEDFYNVMVGMMSVLICVSPLLFKLLIRNYEEAYSLMSWLFVGAFFSSLVSFFGSIYVGEKRTKDVGISSAIGAVLNIVINIILMRKYGVIVAAISTIVSYLIICVYRAIDIKKYVSIEYNYKKIAFGLIIIITLASLNYEFTWSKTIITLSVSLLYNIIFNRRIAVSFYNTIRRRLS